VESRLVVRRSRCADRSLPLTDLKVQLRENADEFLFSVSRIGIQTEA
jgi:hypothetical protein